MPTTRVNGIDVYYERSGEGPRLLFLNGSGTTLATTGMLWQPFTEAFDTVAFDQRGLGQTEAPPEPYSMADYAADAVALCDELGWDTFRVVGISFGGMVAQELAVTWPDRVERLALLCTSPGGAGGSSYPLHELASLPLEERKVRSVELLDTRFTTEWLAEHPDQRTLADFMAARELAEKSPEQERGELAQLDARGHHDVWDRLASVTAPTLVACGRYDGIAPPVNGEGIASRIPGAQLQLFDGGHAFFAQDPAAYPAVIAFLAAS